ncbi:MAG: hypothetical protein QXW32_04675 [Nitrososphaerales archaeon]
MKISYEPYSEVVIKEYTYYPKPETLAATLTQCIQMGQPAVILWCEGVAFIPMMLPPDTDIVAKEYLAGKIIWSSVIFTLMPNYQQTIKIGAIEVPIIDITPNETFRQVALWLKEKVSQFSEQQPNNRSAK